MPPAKATRPCAAKSLSRTEQRSIQSFGRISKPVATKSTLKELETLSYSSEITPPTPELLPEPQPLDCRKRKLATFTECFETGQDTKHRSQAKRLKVESSRPESPTSSTIPRTPCKIRFNQQSLPTPENTPPKDNSKRCQSNRPNSTNESSVESTVYATPPPSPYPVRNSCSAKATDYDLPDGIVELIQFHLSFLRALSLQFAHHGAAAPIDVRFLTPSIAKLWGKRRVVLNDIRRCLAILWLQLNTEKRHRNHSASIFHLYDYGRGKICIECQSTEQKHLVVARHIDEDALHELFINGLRSAWEKWMSSREESCRPDEVAPFIKQLPLAEVMLCPSLEKVKPLFWEGQQRLEDLKVIAVAAQMESATRKDHARMKRPAAVKGRSQSLHDRIQAKELLQSALPPSPSKASLERRAALQRVDEIVSILSLPHTTGHRHTYSLPLLVQTIQNSARSLMSKEEIERCVHLLAEEITRGFVSVVRTAEVVGVVVDHKYRPNDLEERIRLASSIHETVPCRPGQ